MNEQEKFRWAAVSAYGAVPALFLAALFLALFFGGAGQFYGPLNDLFVVVTLALLVLPARALVTVVGASGGKWFRILTRLVLIGLAVAIAGQLLLIAGVISLEASFMTGNLGIMPVIAWGITQAYLGLRYGKPSRAVGWAVASVIALSALVTLTWALGAGIVVWLFSGALVASLAAYFIAIGWVLQRQTENSPTAMVANG